MQYDCNEHLTACSQKLKTKGIIIVTSLISMGTHMRKRGPAIIIGWRNLFVRRRPALSLIKYEGCNLTIVSVATLMTVITLSVK